MRKFVFTLQVFITVYVFLGPVFLNRLLDFKTEILPLGIVAVVLHLLSIIGGFYSEEI